MFVLLFEIKTGGILMKNLVKNRVRLLSVLLCAVMLCPVFASCLGAGGNKTDDTTGTSPSQNGDIFKPGDISGDTGFVFNGGAYANTGYTQLPEALQGMTVKAEGNSRVVSLGATFTITTAKETDVKTLLDHVTVYPKTEMKVEKTSPTTFTATPVAELASGTVYRFILGDEKNPVSSFAFQTETELVIKSVFPADLAVNVPVNTGIEIAFSEVIDKEADLSSYIKITPGSEGTFSLYPDGKTVVFVPKKYLEENTEYTVEIKAGIKGGSGLALLKDKTARFRTSARTDDNAGNEGVFVSLNERMINSLLSDEAAIYYNCYYNGRADKGAAIKQNAVNAEIYRYADAAAAIEAMKAYENQKADYYFSGKTYFYPTDTLTPAGSYKIDPVKVSSYSYSESAYIPLPQLKAGAYLVNLTFTGEGGSKPYQYEAQVMLQVTDLVIYTESAAGKTLVWVNKAGQGAVSGADITAQAFTSNDYWNTSSLAGFTAINAKTSSDGTALLETGNNGAAFINVTVGSESAYALALLSSGYTARAYTDTYYGGFYYLQYNTQSLYASYLFTDREVYFGSDNINFCGVITPVNSGVTMPKSLYVRIGQSKLKTPVTLNEDGTFRGSYAVENYLSYAVVLSFYDENDNCIITKYVRITQEDKPVYRASLSFDKLYYRLGDTIKVTVSASFYDGTPAPGLKFSLGGNYFLGQGRSETVVTGRDGTASVSYPTYAYNFGSTNMQYLNVYAELIGEETTYLNTSASVYYFPGSVYFTSERKDASYSEVYLNYVDTSKLDGKEDFNYPVFPANTVGAPASGTVDVTLRKYEYVKTYKGTSYDPVTKTTTENYVYNQVTTLVSSAKKAFENGVIRLDHIREDDSFRGYYVYNVSYYDGDNKCTYSLLIYALYSDRIYYYDDYRDTPAYELDLTEGPFSVGDEISARLTYDKKPVEGPVLYTVYNTGLSDFTVTADTFKTSFSEEYVAGAQIIATYFNGKAVVDVYANGYLNYDYEKNATLDLKIETDKDTYKPGESVTVKIDAGNAGGYAAVVVAVVDEACFALGEQNVSFLSSYFGGSGVVYPSRNSRFSPFGLGYYQYYAAEKGMNETAPETSAASWSRDESAAPATGGNTAEAESVTVREIFADNPVFEIIALNDEGKGEFTFKAPDNITEWRLTALAVSGLESGRLAEISAGSTTTDIICTLPFFANVSACESYIVGDDVSLSARVYGTALVTAQNVDYICTLADETGTILRTINLSAGSADFARFNFGKLEQGSYEVVVKALCGENSDGVKVSFKVCASGVLADVRKNITPEEISSMSPLAYPVTLSFYNESYDFYLKVANSVYGRRTQRSDSLAAYYVAASACEALFGTKSYISAGLSDIRKTLSSYAGLIPLISYGEGDIELTAKILAIAPDALTEAKKTELKEYLGDYLEGRQYRDEDEMCAALLGLAALGEPVLSDLYYTAEHCASFSLSAKLYLACAFAYIGDFSAAYQIYTELSAGSARDGEANELYFAGINTEENIRLTALALMCASLVEKEDALRLTSYLLSHISTVNLYVLELASYVKYFRPAEAKSSSFSYTLKGERFDVELPVGGAYYLTLTKSELAAFKVSDYDETLRVRATYKGSVEEALGTSAQTGELKITKSVKPYDQSRGLYLVTISYSGTTDRNYAYFDLTDCIPSGARYFRGYQEYGGSYANSTYWNAYLYNSGGQMMNGGLYIYTGGRNPLEGRSPVSFSGSISYIIRAAVNGEFIMEETIAQNVSNGVWAKSRRYALTITEEAWTLKEID